MYTHIYLKNIYRKGRKGHNSDPLLSPLPLSYIVAGETDSQLVNSTYLDNHAMELYQGRLEKSPGAIALRMRWYGTGKIYDYYYCA